MKYHRIQGVSFPFSPLPPLENREDVISHLLSLGIIMILTTVVTVFFTRKEKKQGKYDKRDRWLLPMIWVVYIVGAILILAKYRHFFV